MNLNNSNSGIKDIAKGANVTKEILNEPQITKIENSNKIVESFQNGSHFYIKGPFATIETKNANGRIYPKYIWDREVSKYQEEIEKNTINTLMEWDHPKDRSYVDPMQAIAKINKLWIEDKYVMGEAVILDNAKAEVIKSLIKTGVRLSVSSRGTGHCNINGVVEDFDLITFDMVAQPSDQGAYMYGIYESLNESQKSLFKNKKFSDILVPKQDTDTTDTTEDKSDFNNLNQLDNPGDLDNADNSDVSKVTTNYNDAKDSEDSEDSEDLEEIEKNNIINKEKNMEYNVSRPNITERAEKANSYIRKKLLERRSVQEQKKKRASEYIYEKFKEYTEGNRNFEDISEDLNEQPRRMYESSSRRIRENSNKAFIAFGNADSDNFNEDLEDLEDLNVKPRRIYESDSRRIRENSNKVFIAFGNADSDNFNEDLEDSDYEYDFSKLRKKLSETILSSFKTRREEIRESLANSKDFNNAKFNESINNLEQENNDLLIENNILKEKVNELRKSLKIAECKYQLPKDKQELFENEILDYEYDYIYDFMNYADDLFSRYKPDETESPLNTMENNLYKGKEDYKSNSDNLLNAIDVYKNLRSKNPREPLIANDSPYNTDYNGQCFNIDSDNYPYNAGAVRLYSEPDSMYAGGAGMYDVLQALDYRGDQFAKYELDSNDINNLVETNKIATMVLNKDPLEEAVKRKETFNKVKSITDLIPSHLL